MHHPAFLSSRAIPLMVRQVDVSMLFGWPKIDTERVKGYTSCETKLLRKVQR